VSCAGKQCACAHCVWDSKGGAMLCERAQPRARVVKFFLRRQEKYS
jgi:hypothetical protein